MILSILLVYRFPIEEDSIPQASFVIFDNFNNSERFYNSSILYECNHYKTFTKSVET